MHTVQLPSVKGKMLFCDNGAIGFKYHSQKEYIRVDSKDLSDLFWSNRSKTDRFNYKIDWLRAKVQVMVKGDCDNLTKWLLKKGYKCEVDFCDSEGYSVRVYLEKQISE